MDLQKTLKFQRPSSEQMVIQNPSHHLSIPTKPSICGEISPSIVHGKEGLISRMELEEDDIPEIEEKRFQRHVYLPPISIKCWAKFVPTKIIISKCSLEWQVIGAVSIVDVDNGSVLINSLMKLTVTHFSMGNHGLLVVKFITSNNGKRILMRSKRDFNLLFFGFGSLFPHWSSGTNLFRKEL